MGKVGIDLAELMYSFLVTCTLCPFCVGVCCGSRYPLAKVAECGQFWSVVQRSRQVICGAMAQAVFIGSSRILLGSLSGVTVGVAQDY